MRGGEADDGIDFIEALSDRGDPADHMLSARDTIATKVRLFGESAIHSDDEEIEEP